MKNSRQLKPADGQNSNPDPDIWYRWLSVCLSVQNQLVGEVCEVSELETHLDVGRSMRNFCCRKTFAIQCAEIRGSEI